METKACLWCGDTFKRTELNKHNWQIKKFCCQKHSEKYQYEFKQKPKRKEKSKFKHEQRTCRWCNDIFIPTSKVNLFCSKKCRDAFKYNKKTKADVDKDRHHKCIYCGKQFTSKTIVAPFCSNACHYGWIDNIGTHRTRQKANVYKITLDIYLNLIKKCAICGWEKNIHIHHIIPKSQGGKDEMSNYMALCCNCHQLLHQTNEIRLVKEEIEKWSKRD